MKTIKNTRIGKFLSDKNLGHLLAGVADMPPSVPLLTWLHDAVQEDDMLKAKEKHAFRDLCRAELEAVRNNKVDRSREPKKWHDSTDQRKEGKRKANFFSGIHLTMF